MRFLYIWYNCNDIPMRADAVFFSYANNQQTGARDCTILQFATAQPSNLIRFQFYLSRDCITWKNRIMELEAEAEKAMNKNNSDKIIKVERSKKVRHLQGMKRKRKKCSPKNLRNVKTQ